MKGNPPTFAAFLAAPISGRLVERGLFGPSYVRFSKFLLALAYLFETGALIGRAKSEQVRTLARMFCHPGTEDETVNQLQRIAEEWLGRFDSAPASFVPFIYGIELQSRGVIFDSFESMMKSRKLFNQKMKLDDCAQGLQAYTFVGIAFGSRFPELTERLYRSGHENIDPAKWAHLRGLGLALPEEPTVITLEEQEATALAWVAAYAHMCVPHLVEPLGLGPYVTGDSGADTE